MSLFSPTAVTQVDPQSIPPGSLMTVPLPSYLTLSQEKVDRQAPIE